MGMSKKQLNFSAGNSTRLLTNTTTNKTDSSSRPKSDNDQNPDQNQSKIDGYFNLYSKPQTDYNSEHSNKIVKRDSNGYYIFENYPDFKPNLSPREMFLRGSFGGTYWRPIYSSVLKKNLSNVHKQYPESWWENIPDHWLTTAEKDYDISIN